MFTYHYYNRISQFNLCVYVLVRMINILYNYEATILIRWT